LLDLKKLRYFQAVAEELHFGRAAARVRVAQPALSRQIMQLEQDLGVLLLNRTQRVVELTPAGTVFLERVTKIIDDVERAVNDALRISRGEVGRLAVGFIHSSTYGLLPAIIERFVQLYPGVELEMREMSIADQHVALSRGLIDVGLLRPQQTSAEIDLQILMEDPFLIAVPGGHPLARKTRCRLADLAQEPFVAFSKRESPLFFSRIMEMCHSAGFAPNVVQSATQIHTIVGLVGAGIGVAIVPATGRNLHPNNVRFLDIVDAPEPVYLALAWQRGRETPAIISFCHAAGLVVEVMQQAKGH